MKLCRTVVRHTLDFRNTYVCRMPEEVHTVGWNGTWTKIVGLKAIWADTIRDVGWRKPTKEKRSSLETSVTETAYLICNFFFFFNRRIFIFLSTRRRGSIETTAMPRRQCLRYRTTTVMETEKRTTPSNPSRTRENSVNIYLPTNSTIWLSIGFKYVWGWRRLSYYWLGWINCDFEFKKKNT